MILPFLANLLTAPQADIKMPLLRHNAIKVRVTPSREHLG